MNFEKETQFNRPHAFNPGRLRTFDLQNSKIISLFFKSLSVRQFVREAIEK